MQTGTLWGLGTGFVMCLVAACGDPLRKPFEVLFRVVFVGAAGLFGAFFWGLWRQPRVPVSKHNIETTEQVRERIVKRTRLSTRRYPDGTRDTCLEQEEERT